MKRISLFLFCAFSCFSSLNADFDFPMKYDESFILERIKEINDTIPRLENPREVELLIKIRQLYLDQYNRKISKV